ncbi:MAG: hypothetical protein MPN21_27145 [Thermoanaerobaculia bacterium]|nr:hypothetical protein [Thermoanaerobaculia bacterium]
MAAEPTEPSRVSANHPDIRLEQAHVLRPSFGAVQWTPVEDVDGIATDLAFNVEAAQVGSVIFADGFESGDTSLWQ